jgi:hypothetical protein
MLNSLHCQLNYRNKCGDYVKKSPHLDSCPPKTGINRNYPLKKLLHRERITPIGSHPQTPSKDRLTHHIVRIGPVPLDIRPLSDYQQSLIDTILSLKSNGWTDGQIANHFNLTGLLTPRGHQFIPQSIFSIRKKYAIRLKRLSGNWCGGWRLVRLTRWVLLISPPYPLIKFW